VVVEALHRMGIRCVMLTGDNKRTAAAVAAQVWAKVDDGSAKGHLGPHRR